MELFQSNLSDKNKKLCTYIIVFMQNHQCWCTRNLYLAPYFFCNLCEWCFRKNVINVQTLSIWKFLTILIKYSSNYIAEMERFISSSLLFEFSQWHTQYANQKIYIAKWRYIVWGKNLIKTHNQTSVQYCWICKTCNIRESTC